MDKLTALRDYALVAYLITQRVPVRHNGDGSYCAEVTPAVFDEHYDNYRLQLKPLLTKITALKRELSSARNAPKR